MKKVIMMCVLGVSLSYGSVNDICLKMQEKFSASQKSLNTGNHGALEDVKYYAKEVAISCSQVTGSNKTYADEMVYYAKRILTAVKENGL